MRSSFAAELVVVVLAACSGKTGPTRLATASTSASSPHGVVAPTAQQLATSSRLGHGSLAVKVVDADGMAVSGATLTTRPATSVVQSDAAGLAIFVDLPAGTYDVWVRKAGFHPYGLPGVAVTAGGIADLDAVLAPGVECALSDSDPGLSCLSCHAGRPQRAHRADFVAGHGSRGPGPGVQDEMLLGEGGFEYPNRSYTTARVGPHATGHPGERCVQCHMSTVPTPTSHGATWKSCATDADCAGVTVQDAAGAAQPTHCAGASATRRGACVSPTDTVSGGHIEAQHFGGSSYAMRWTAADGAEYEHSAACQGCHTDISDFNRDLGVDWDCDPTTTGVQDEIRHLLAALGDCLVAQNPKLDDGTGALITRGFDDAGATAAQLEAAWNYLFVKSDASMGIHNAVYAAQLLRDSIDDLACRPTLTCTRP